MQIAIASAGYVGLSNTVLLSQHNEVVAIDVIPEKVEMLNRGISPIEDVELSHYWANKTLNFKATFVIVANRVTDDIRDVIEKVCSRDLFGKD